MLMVAKVALRLAREASGPVPWFLVAASLTLLLENIVTRFGMNRFGRSSGRYSIMVAAV